MLGLNSPQITQQGADQEEKQIKRKTG